MDRTVRSRWSEAIGPTLPAERVSELLGVDTAAVRAMAGRRELLELITTDEVPLYPSWQFQAGAVVPGLAELLTTLSSAVADDWTIASWCQQPQQELDGRSVADALAAVASRTSGEASASDPLEALIRRVVTRAAARWSR